MPHTFFSEPVKLKGQGEYNLNVMKEMNATESFLGLAENVRKCQNQELFACTTRKYVDTHLEKCRCLPLNMKLSNKVSK